MHGWIRHTDLGFSELCKVMFWFVRGQTMMPAHMHVHCKTHNVMQIILLGSMGNHNNVTEISDGWEKWKYDWLWRGTHYNNIMLQSTWHQRCHRSIENSYHKFKQEDCLAAPLCPHTHHSLNASEQQLIPVCEGNTYILWQQEKLSSTLWS